jgi:methyl-accepting chemotaxis protein
MRASEMETFRIACAWGRVPDQARNNKNGMQGETIMSGLLNGLMGGLTVARKLQLLIANSVVALVIVAYIGFYSTSSVSEALTQSHENTIPSLSAIADIQTQYIRYRLAIAQHLLAGDESQMGTIERQLEGVSEQLQKQLDTYEKSLLSDDKDRQMLATDKRILQEYQTVVGKIIELSRTFGKDDAANLNSTEGNPTGNRLEAALKAHIEYKSALARELASASNANARRFLLLSAVVGLGAILIIALIGLFMMRGIGASFRDMEQTITRIEDLDFTARADAGKSDELGRMAAMLNQLLDKLQANLKTIALNAEGVAAASTRMTETSEQVAEASRQQSGAASDMAATVQEITVSINQVGDRAVEANHISAESGKQAAAGEKTIGQTVADIREIADTVHAASNSIRELEVQGNKISAVVAVIKEVADQTNLLALNAAIEAARAGEQGRGFAVVADEVRKLAERTSASTQEIGGTISAMQATAGEAVRGMSQAVEKVAQGVARANDANESILKIGAGSRNAVGMVNEITEAIREQGTATNTIATQVERIAQMAEESSAASAESARAARELDRLAEGMQQIVAAYRL